MAEDEAIAAELELAQRDAAAIEPTAKRRKGMADALARYYAGVLALRGVRRNGANDDALGAVDPIPGVRRIDGN